MARFPRATDAAHVLGPPAASAAASERGGAGGREVPFQESWKIIGKSQERRLVFRLLFHWSELAGGAAGIPPLWKLNPEALPVPWACCALWVPPGPERPARFEHIGAELSLADTETAAPGETPPSPVLRQALRAAVPAHEDAVPVIVGGGLRHGPGKVEKFRAVALPFGPGAGRVARLLLAASSRSFAVQAGDASSHMEPIRAHAYQEGRWREATLPAGGAS